MEEEIELQDSELVSVRISSFFSPKKVSCDLHLRLGANRYLRVFRAGEPFEEAELKAYESDRGVRNVYFSKEHRSSYVNSSVALLQKITLLPQVPLRTKFGLAQIISELYMQELFACDDDLRSTFVEKGKLISSVVAAWVDVEPGLETFLLKFYETDDTIESIAFLTGLFAATASRRFPWKSRRTTETLLFASYLCDIGLFALKPEIYRTKPRKLKREQKRDYQKHPEISYLLLETCASSVLSDNILLIVRQHHEYCDGSGFPQALQGEQILLLAKLMTLSGDLIRTASDSLLPPAEAVKVLFRYSGDRMVEEDPEVMVKYDNEILKPFFLIFGKNLAEAKK